MITLYDLERSGNCYRARLMLALLGVAYAKRKVDLPTGEQKKPEYLAVNPLGQIPALDDDGVLIRDSQAILVYLAGKSGSGAWYPHDRLAQATVQQWLSLVSGDLYQGLVAARAIKLGIRAGDHAAAVKLGERALAVVEQQLTRTPWLAGDNPTIADVAVYPYVALAPVGEIELSPYPSIISWMQRIEALPGYVPPPRFPAKA